MVYQLKLFIMTLKWVGLGQIKTINDAKCKNKTRNSVREWSERGKASQLTRVQRPPPV